MFTWKFKNELIFYLRQAVFYMQISFCFHIVHFERYFTFQINKVVI